MHLESWFEDFEAEIDHKLQGRSSSEFKGIELARWAVLVINTIGGPGLEVAAVQLGHDFIAGVALESEKWVIFPLAQIKSIEPLIAAGSKLPGLKSTEHSMDEYLMLLPRQLRLKLFLSDEILSNCSVVDCSSNRLVVREASGKFLIVPNAAVQKFEVNAVDNLGRV